MNYDDFIKSKFIKTDEFGFDVGDELLNSNLFDYQRDIVKRALKKGKYALFVDTGLGKSIMQLNFADAVCKKEGCNALILAPLVVAYQLEVEAKKFGIDANLLHGKLKDIKKGINITNYDNLKNIDASQFDCIVLDESSILKNFTGKTKNLLVEKFKDYKYKLCCTATPSPNDFMELGNHSEFLDVMPSDEMLMRYFINDTMNFGTYRLKKYAESEFWEWVSSWAECISGPADLGFDGSKHILPKLNENFIEVNFDDTEYLQNGQLFSFAENNATTLAKNKKKTLNLRIEKLKEILNEDEQHLIWVDTNLEADEIKKHIPQVVEVRGNEKDEVKAKKLLDFANGKINWLVTKSSIAGMGMNFQNANNMTFLGLNYSYERYYQAVRRMYRFGQKKEVNVNIIVADNENSILKTIMRKKEQHEIMKQSMLKAVKKARITKELKKDVNLDIKTPKFLNGSATTGNAISFISNDYAIYNSDTVKITSIMKDNIFDFSIYSPPFSNLYIYSDSIYDMGNSLNDDEFFKQYDFLIKEKYRTHKDNTYSLVHCKDLPAYKGRDGFSGLIDFTGRIIEYHIKNGFVYQGKYRVWKDPVIEMQRTKSHGLLHKNFMNRSEVVRQGMADYVLIFKKIEDKNGFKIKKSDAEIGEEAIKRCANLWANDNEFINVDEVSNNIKYGIFDYNYFIKNKDDILQNVESGRNISIVFKEDIILKDNIQVGLIDNTLDTIKDLDKKGFKFHSRVYLTNGSEIVTFRNWNGEIQDGLVKKDMQQMEYVGKNKPYHRGDNRLYSIHIWQRYASPIWNDIDNLPVQDKFSWFDISQTNVLNTKQAKSSKDEKHICPLQLDLIEKSILIYTKENDIVASFFGGIGSEPTTALKLNRKAYAVELKKEYFEVMKQNIRDTIKNKISLF